MTIGTDQPAPQEGYENWYTQDIQSNESSLSSSSEQSVASSFIYHLIDLCLCECENLHTEFKEIINNIKLLIGEDLLLSTKIEICNMDTIDAVNYLLEEEGHKLVNNSKLTSNLGSIFLLLDLANTWYDNGGLLVDWSKRGSPQKFSTDLLCAFVTYLIEITSYEKRIEELSDHLPYYLSNKIDLEDILNQSRQTVYSLPEPEHLINEELEIIFLFLKKLADNRNL